MVLLGMPVHQLPPLSTASWHVLFLGEDCALAGFGGEMAGWAVKACAGSPSSTLSCTWVCWDPSIHPCTRGEAQRGLRPPHVWTGQPVGTTQGCAVLSLCAPGAVEEGHISG